MRGIYDGVRVVELASGIAAPYATMFLADHGADVVKVEPPAGDPYRGEAGFQTFNRNKRSVVLEPGDPDRDAGRPARRRRRAWSPTGRGRPPALRAANPGALIVTMPPWGERGPYVTDPATPDLVAAAAGIFWNQQSYTEAPVQLVVPVVAYGTATLGALALAAGLFARERDGVAPCFEVSWVAGAAAIQLGETQRGRRAGRGAPRQRPDGRRRAGSPATGSSRPATAAGSSSPAARPASSGDCSRSSAAPTCRRSPPARSALGTRRPRRARPSSCRSSRRPSPPAPGRRGWRRCGKPTSPPSRCRPARSSSPATWPHANHCATSVEHPELGRVEMMGVPLVMEAAAGEVRRRAPLLGEHTAEVRAEVAAGAWPPQPARPAATGAAPGRDPRHRPRRLHRRAGGQPSPGDAGQRRGQGRAARAVTRSGRSARCSPPGTRASARSRSTCRQAGDRQRLYRLVEGVDVVVENFRPGVATRLGCDDAALRAVNPDLVTLSSSGYGDDASMASVPAFDPLLQALGGIMAAQGGVTVTRRRGRAGLRHGRRARRDHPADQRVRAGQRPLRPAADRAGPAGADLAGADVDGGPGRRAHPLRGVPASARSVASTTPARGGGQGCVEGEDGGWWFVEGDLRTPIVRTGLINQPVAADNGLCVTEHHPQFGEITQFGQLVVGAGPPPRRGPLLDEHRAWRSSVS